MNRINLVGSKLSSGKSFTSLEQSDVSFAETILFEVVSEDFESNRSDAERKFIHLCTLK
jgi:hypothetical protein